MSEPECPAESMRNIMAFSVRDWGQNGEDAWLWGIVMGWDDYCLRELQDKHGWSPEGIDRLKWLHTQFTEKYPHAKEDIDGPR